MSLSNTMNKEIAKTGNEIDKLQSRIRDLLTEKAQLQARPLSADEAEQTLRRVIADQRQRASENISTMVRVVANGGQHLNTLTNGLLAPLCSTVEDQKPTAVDLFPLLAILFGNALEEILAPMVRQYALDHEGISDADRAKRVEAIEKELDKLEQQEEIAITECELHNIWSFRRREEFRPEVVLGL